jgi:signal transduction histidine kinase
MKVLIAEDDPVSRRLLQSYLERWGHEVTLATGGGEAWRLFGAGNYPIVISDWMMPEIDGPDLIRRIRASSHPGYVYIILLTARSQKEDVVAGMESGADDFLTKPFDREELRVRLRAGERIIHLEQSLARQNQALREAQAALVQSEKLASLGRLAAGVAHEINNPVSYVANNLAVLRRDTRAALAVLDAYRNGNAAVAVKLEADADLPFFREHYSRTFDKSLQGLQRVRDIVRNLCDFARLDEAEFKETDLNAGLAATVEILHNEITKKEIRLQTDYQPLPGVYGCPGKLNQAFLNLLINAVEACDAGGMMSVRSRLEFDETVIIEIQDNGRGIQPEHRSRLFEPFFTTKPVGHGMGLGLSVSFGIVRDHGGTIEVDSEPGRGSTFRIRLPLQRTEVSGQRSEDRGQETIA